MGKITYVSMKNWLPSFALMGVISMLSSVQGPAIDALGFGKESYHINAHFFLFMALCVCYYKATKNFFYSILMTSMFGVVDELHQMFTPFRSSSYFDIFIDTMGGLIPGVFLWKFQHILPKKLKNWLNK